MSKCLLKTCLHHYKWHVTEETFKEEKPDFCILLFFCIFWVLGGKIKVANSLLTECGHFLLVGVKKKKKTRNVFPFSAASAKVFKAEEGLHCQHGQTEDLWDNGLALDGIWSYCAVNELGASQNPLLLPKDDTLKNNQWLHPSTGSIQGHMHHSGAANAGPTWRLLRTQPTNVSWAIERVDPSQRSQSQDLLCTGDKCICFVFLHFEIYWVSTYSNV